MSISAFPLSQCGANHILRPVCSLQSAPPSSSTSSPSLSQFLVNCPNPIHCSRRRLVPQRKSSQPQTSANFLMSLLVPFIAMLEKRWSDRYLRHIDGSMIEHCGDRQRKSDGLTIPLICQESHRRAPDPPTLTCGLSKYVVSQHLDRTIVIPFCVRIVVLV